MTISSIFCIHVHVRLSASDIQMLKDMFDGMVELGNTAGVEIPQIYIFIKDSEEISVKNKDDSHELKRIVFENCQIPVKFQKYITFLPRNLPPPEFIKTGKLDALENTSYLETIEQFLAYSVLSATKLMRVDDGSNNSLISTLNHVQQVINSPNFKENFLKPFEQRMREIMEVHVQCSITDYKESIKSAAEVYPVEDTTVEEFLAYLNMIKDQNEINLLEEMLLNFQNDNNALNVVNHSITQILNKNNSSFSEAEYIFRSRKNEYENQQSYENERQLILDEKEAKRQQLLIMLEENQINSDGMVAERLFRGDVDKLLLEAYQEKDYELRRTKLLSLLKTYQNK